VGIQGSGALARPNWIALENYFLGSAWKIGVRLFVEKIAAFEDLAELKRNYDLFIDNNYKYRSQGESCL
jgi:hypothetical protein